MDSDAFRHPGHRASLRRQRYILYTFSGECQYPPLLFPAFYTSAKRPSNSRKRRKDGPPAPSGRPPRDERSAPRRQRTPVAFPAASKGCGREKPFRIRENRKGFPSAAPAARAGCSRLQRSAAGRRRRSGTSEARLRGGGHGDDVGIDALVPVEEALHIDHVAHVQRLDGIVDVGARAAEVGFHGEGVGRAVQ